MMPATVDYDFYEDCATCCFPTSAAQEAEIILLRPDTMKPKQNRSSEREICVRDARCVCRVKPRAEATMTAKKEIGERLLYSLSDK